MRSALNVPEARVIIFLGEALSDLCTSLRTEQIEALTDALDMSQKVVFLEIMGTVSPPENGGFSASDGKRATWARLVESAKGLIAAGPEGN